jgi:hypothetical protein
VGQLGCLNLSSTAWGERMAIKTEKSIFYHIPKCGGSYVKKAMKRSIQGYRRKCHNNGIPHELGLKKGHTTPNGIRDEDKEGRFSFCFVRHPVTWYRSFWCYSVKNGKPDIDFPLYHSLDDEYEKFIINTLAEFPYGIVSRIYQSYMGEDLSGIDFIGRMELLEDDLVIALNLAGEDFDVGMLRETPPYNQADIAIRDRAVISKELENKIIKADKWTMDNFYA